MGNFLCIPVCGCARDETRSPTPGDVKNGAKERSERSRTSAASKGSNSSNNLLSPKQHQNLDERLDNIKPEIEKELKGEINNVQPEDKDLPEEPLPGGSEISVYVTAASLSVEKTDSGEQLITACETLLPEVDPDQEVSSAPNESTYLTVVEHAEKPLSEDPEKDVYYTLSSSSVDEVSTTSSSVVDVQNMELVPSASVQQQPFLSLESFLCRGVLGRGSYGKVLLAEQKTSRKLVAIKALKKASLTDKKHFERLMYEKEILQTVSIPKNPFLVNLFATFQSKDHVFFVMEYGAGGDLRRNFHNLGGFTEPQAMFYNACIVLGLEFLHQKKIIHRDLKLDNIVLDQQGYAKITDFGMSKTGMGHEERTNSFCGSRPYMAPEIHRGQSYTRVVDWWSVGIIIYELLVGKRPFRGKDKEELCRNIVSNTVQYPSFLSPQAVNILRWLLEKNPSRRLGAGDDAREVRRQAFFRMINWTKLQLRIMKPPLLPVIREEIISNSAVLLTTQRTSLTPEQQEAFIDFEWIADGTP